MRKTIIFFLCMALSVTMLSGCSVRVNFTAKDNKDTESEASVAEESSVKEESETKEEQPVQNQEPSESQIEEEKEEGSNKEDQTSSHTSVFQKKEKNGTLGELFGKNSDSKSEQTEEQASPEESSEKNEESSKAQDPATEVTPESEAPTEPKEQAEGNKETVPTKTEEDAVVLSENWYDLEFAIEGHPFRVTDMTYKQLTELGWSMDLAENGYEDGYIMNKGDKTFGIINLQNPKYADSNSPAITIGLQNISDKACDITECNVWSIDITNMHGSKLGDNPIQFKIAKGIKTGSSYDEIIKAFGEPEDVYRADDLGYYALNYSNNFTEYMRLVVFDEFGLQEIDLSRH